MSSLLLNQHVRVLCFINLSIRLGEQLFGSPVNAKQVEIELFLDLVIHLGL